MIALIEELETQCEVAERQLGELDWDALEVTWSEHARLTHALDKAMLALPLPIDPKFRAHADARLKRIFNVRAAQLKRIEGYHSGVAARLATISKFRAAARSIGPYRAESKLANLDTTQ